MNALELLTEQHDEVDELFEQIEATEDGEEKAMLFRELANNLAAHAEMEERLFYPAVMAKQTEEILLESVEEHLSVKRVLADLMKMDTEDEQFDAKIAVVKEQVEHHAREEEEGELFPKVRKLFSADELDGLGGEMAALFEELMAQQPAKNIPMQTERAAPL